MKSKVTSLFNYLLLPNHNQFTFMQILLLLLMTLEPAASIWFEIWGVVDPGQQHFDFPGKFPRNFAFFRQLRESILQGKFLKNSDFSKHIFEQFRFFQGNFQKISIFSGNLKKKFDFPGKN